MAIANWSETKASPRLMAARCGACGEVFYPAPKVCTACLSTDLSDTPLSDEGKLYVCSKIHVQNPKFPGPYVVAYVDLPEGVRIFGQLDAESGEPPLGSSVRLYPGQVGIDKQGGAIIGVRFKPL
ncbi:MAG: Zn-ribbon domain-containing OB-fold protein [Hyphomonadaceae bacterium]